MTTFTEEEIEQFVEKYRRIIETAKKIAPEYLKSQGISYRYIEDITFDEEGDWLDIAYDDSHCSSCYESQSTGFHIYNLAKEEWVNELRQKTAEREAEEKKKKELEEQKKKVAAEQKKIEAAKKERELYLQLKQKYEGS